MLADQRKCATTAFLLNTNKRFYHESTPLSISATIYVWKTKMIGCSSPFSEMLTLLVQDKQTGLLRVLTVFTCLSTGVLFLMMFASVPAAV